MHFFMLALVGAREHCTLCGSKIQLRFFIVKLRKLEICYEFNKKFFCCNILKYNILRGGGDFLCY